jgi:hypothetical protein
MSIINTIFIRGGPLAIPPSVQQLIREKQQWTMYPSDGHAIYSSSNDTNLRVTRIPLVFDAKSRSWIHPKCGNLILQFHARSIGSRRVQTIMYKCNDVTLAYPIELFPTINNSSEEMHYMLQQYIVAMDDQNAYLSDKDVILEAVIAYVPDIYFQELSAAGSNWSYKATVF